MFLGGIAKVYNLSDDVKKCQQTFLAPLPEMDSISILGNYAKKCQQLCTGPRWLEMKEKMTSIEVLAGKAKEGLGSNERIMDSQNGRCAGVDDNETNLRVVIVFVGDAEHGRKRLKNIS